VVADEREVNSSTNDPQGSSASSSVCLEDNPAVVFDEVHGVRLNGDSEMAMHGDI
jgi:hypothetical protein